MSLLIVIVPTFDKASTFIENQSWQHCSKIYLWQHLVVWYGTWLCQLCNELYEVLLLERLHSNWCQKIVLKKTKTAEELFFLVASYSRKRKEVFSSHFLGFQQLSRCDKFLFFTAANFSGIFCLLNSLVFWPRKKWLL